MKVKAAPIIDHPAIWGAVRGLARAGSDITAAAVAHRLGAARAVNAVHRIGEYLRATARAGYLAAVPGRPGCFALARDTADLAPRVRADGTETAVGLSRQRLWDLTRVLREWSALDLAVHASVDDHTVAESYATAYARALTRAGYLQRIGTQPERWRLLPGRWTGPQPPQVRPGGVVWDPNTGREYRPDRPARTQEAPHG